MFELQPFRKSALTKKDFFTSFFDRMFDDDFNLIRPFGSSFDVDVREKDNAYLVDADLPGFKKEAVKVSYHDNYLTISAKRDDEIKEEKKDYIRHERSKGEVWRQFYIENVDEDKIEAEFTNGVLKLVLPKKEIAPVPKKEIAIK